MNRTPEAQKRMDLLTKEQTSEQWLTVSVDLQWVMLRALEREKIRKARQTIEVVRWRDGYPHWLISDEET